MTVSPTASVQLLVVCHLQRFHLLTSELSLPAACVLGAGAIIRDEPVEDSLGGLEEGCLVEVASSTFGRTNRRRDCHFAASPSTFSRCFNMDKQGVSSK